MAENTTNTWRLEGRENLVTYWDKLKQDFEASEEEQVRKDLFDELVYRFCVQRRTVGWDFLEKFRCCTTMEEADVVFNEAWEKIEDSHLVRMTPQPHTHSTPISSEESGDATSAKCAKMETNEVFSFPPKGEGVRYVSQEWYQKVLQWSNESEVTDGVRLALSNVLECLGFNLRGVTEVLLAKEWEWYISVDDVEAGARADVVLIREISDCRVLAAVEVKKPDPNPDGDIPIGEKRFNTKNINQLRGYLRSISAYYGVPQPFGILTTYSHWQIFRLVREGEDEILQQSKLFQFNDPELVNSLAHFLWQSLESKLVSMEYIYKKNTVVKLEESEINELQNNPMEMEARERVYEVPVWRDDGGFIYLEQHGRSWVVCDKAKKICVAKHGAVESLKKELEVWEKMYDGEGARMTVLLKRNVLLMPYVKTLSKEEKEAGPGNELKEKIAKHVKKWADKKMVHADLRWRHIGRLGRDERQIMFIDFDIVEEDATPEVCFNKMKAKLLKEDGVDLGYEYSEVSNGGACGV